MFSLAIKLINSLFVQRAAARYIINELEPAKKNERRSNERKTERELVGSSRKIGFVIARKKER